MSVSSTSLFPPLTRSAVLACQLSSWYPQFASVSIKTITIRPLDPKFREYLEADGVQIPEGAENIVASSDLSDDEASDEDQLDSVVYAFPELDARIREAISEFGAVFPKLNWSAPRDAAWILPQSSPLKCTSPADVYLLLKSSDFANHDLNPELVFEGCSSEARDGEETYELELSLRKWYSVAQSREFRCFVRDNLLLGISQRDSNYYEFLNNAEIQAQIRTVIFRFWQEQLQHKWSGGQHYIFDVLMTRDLARCHLVDINPYAPRTDALLLSYEELQTLACSPTSSMPELAVIDSPSHPDAARNAPAFQHNMLPREAFEMSEGRTLQDFNHILTNAVFNSSNAA